MLEQVIAARRKDETPPAIDATSRDFARCIDGASARAAEPLTRAPRMRSPRGVRAGRLAPRVARTRARWRFEFVPTPALSERGVNVNSVRARLQEIGEILQATPHVRGEGGIVFEFVVATGVEESTFAGWHEDNLTYTPVEEAAPARPTPGEDVPRPTTGQPATPPRRCSRPPTSCASTSRGSTS